MIVEAPVQVFEREDWELHKMQSDIEVFLRDADDSDLKELKSTTIIEAPLTAIMAILSDIDNLPKWVYNCKTAEKLKVLSDTEFIYRNVTKLPWPMQSREFVMRSVTLQDENTLEVFSMSSAEAGFLPVNKKFIRIDMIESYWRLIPESANCTRVEYFLKSDPGVKLPALVVNAGLDIGPIKTMKKLKELAEATKARVDFICDMA